MWIIRFYFLARSEDKQGCIFTRRQCVIWSYYVTVCAIMNVNELRKGALVAGTDGDMAVGGGGRGEEGGFLST